MAERVLVVGGNAENRQGVIARLRGLAYDLDVRTCPDPEAAPAILADEEIERLLVTTPGPDLDLVGLLHTSFELWPRLDVLVVVPALPTVPWEAFGLRRVRYAELDGASEASRLAFVEQPAKDEGLVRPARSPLDVVDVALLHLVTGRTAAVRLGWAGARGLLGFVGGQLVCAETRRLTGAEAFSEMALWDDWLVEAVSGTELERPANVSLPTVELIAETMRLRLELEDWSEWVHTDPGAPPLSDAAPSLGEWWDRVLARRRLGARIVIAHEVGARCDCALRICAAVASELGVEREWADPSPTGPTFIRLHPSGGGLLSLTCVPIVDANRFQFEAFARRAEAVIMCCPSCPESDDWLRSVADAVPVVIRRPNGAEAQNGCCPALGRLAEMP